MPPAGRKSPVGVVLLYVTIALLLLLLLASFSPNPHGRTTHRRLKLHVRNSTAGGDRHAVPFDPAIADLERRLDDKEWEREHYRLLHGHGEGDGPDDHMAEWEEFMRTEEDFINDEDRFNLADRIRELFPKIDVAPADGFVSADELTQWNLAQARSEQLHRSEREMELYDKNGDGIVSFQDFQAHSSKHGDDNSMGFLWWKEEHFNASDLDGDGFLNKKEFNDFIHPSDSENPKIINVLCKQEIRQRDKDGDGKLNFEEFFHGIHDHLHGFDDEGQDISDVGNMTLAKERFSKLDKDSDGFLSEHEMETVLDKIYLTERYYARQQANHAISEQADTDRDGRLTLNEMIESPFAFYGSLLLSDEEDYYHDEFR